VIVFIMSVSLFKKLGLKVVLFRPIEVSLVGTNTYVGINRNFIYLNYSF